MGRPATEPAPPAMAALVAFPYPASFALAVATCTAAPAYTVRWKIGFYPTTLLEVGILLTIAAFAVESWRGRAAPRLPRAMLWPAMLLWLAGAISVIVAPDQRAALGLYRAYILEPVAFGFVAANLLTSAGRAAALMAGLATGGLAAGIANSAVVLAAIAHGAYDVVNSPPVVIYETANAVALYLVPLVAVAGAVTLHWPDRRGRLVGAAIAAVGALCTLLSFSRGGYLALAAVAIGLALSHRRRWRLLAGVAVVAIALLLVPAVRRRVATEVDLHNPANTLVSRFEIWSAAWQMLRTRPIFGAGLAGYATRVAPYWKATGAPVDFIYPHNIVLSAWSETGVLGVAAFAWIFFVLFRDSWHGWRRGDRAWRSLQLGVLLAMVAVVIHGLVDVPYWKNDLSLEFWAIAAITLAPSLPRPGLRN